MEFENPACVKQMTNMRYGLDHHDGHADYDYNDHGHHGTHDDQDDKDDHDWWVFKLMLDVIPHVLEELMIILNKKCDTQRFLKLRIWSIYGGLVRPLLTEIQRREYIEWPSALKSSL